MTRKELVHDCTVNKVPFPALETLEDRRLFPKRYFLFFDIFVRAGRHNRYLWKKAIRENNGENDKRFGPAIFEAHVRTTVRENYFKWIFQQLSDIHEVEDQDVRAFQMEYDEGVYTNLPKTLVCTHMELTRFPFKNLEIDYGKSTGEKNNEHEAEDDEDNDSYFSATNVNQAVTRSPGPESENSLAGQEREEKFFLVHKNCNTIRFNEIREQQRKDIKLTIEKARGQHKAILDGLKDTINKIRQVKKSLPETDPIYKEAIAEAKKTCDYSKTHMKGKVKDHCERNADDPLKTKQDFQTQR